MARHLLPVLLVPAAGAVIGVWAEFADLNPPLLLAIAVPAIAVATVSAAHLTAAGARPARYLLMGGALGLLMFALSESTYLVIHLSRGGTFDSDFGDSRAVTALTLLGIHVAVGAVTGLGVGAAVAVVTAAVRAMGRRAPAHSRAA